MLSRLNGIFALAIYDKINGNLWLARDGLGVKPLYVVECVQGVCFASEVKALLPFLDNVPLSFNVETLHRLLTYLWCPGDGTLLHEVRKLGPGEYLKIQEGKIIRRQKWYTSPQARIPNSTMSSAEAITAVQNGLREAVRRQLVADVPVGAFLSGGLDSSAVVAFAREFSPNIQCFTIETPNGEDNGIVADLPYAVQVANHLGVQLEVVTVDSSNIAQEIESMIWQLDEPLADPAAFNVLQISRHARSKGIKVLLSGAGGDDLFTGYRRHLALRYERLWNWVPDFLKNSFSSFASSLDQQSVFARRLSRFALTFGSNDENGLAEYFTWARRADLIPLYNSALREKIMRIKAEQPMLEYLRELSPCASPIDKMLALEQRFFLADHNLTYTDKMSMAVGVEVRVPYLDNDLVALAARIPEHFKQRGRVGKWVLKKAMKPYLPQNVIYRPKTGFGSPLRRWIRNDLADLVAENLSEKCLRERGIFDPQAVSRLITENRKGHIDASYTIFSLLCIEIWCRKFIDNTGLSVTMRASET